MENHVSFTISRGPVERQPCKLSAVTVESHGTLDSPFPARAGERSRPGAPHCPPVAGRGTRSRGRRELRPEGQCCLYDSPVISHPTEKGVPASAARWPQSETREQLLTEPFPDGCSACGTFDTWIRGPGCDEKTHMFSLILDREEGRNRET